MSEVMPIRLRFRGGTLEVVAAESFDKLPAACSWDVRTRCFRAPAMAYAEVVLALHQSKIEFVDEARHYSELATGLRVHREARPYQSEAIDAWIRAKGRGVVVLPTGAGKTHVAMMAIDRKRRATLIVAPTLDLVRQWYDVLRTNFGCEVGVIGGGDYRVLDLTVTTYDSAYLHMENIGDRFGLVVFDECHHLPGETYSLAAELCIAPFRLGLTATPERQDGRDAFLAQLIGPTVYRRDIVDLAGNYLAEYETVRMVVDLSAEERAAHDRARATYRDFVRKQGIRMSEPGGWQEFIRRSSFSREGREAMQAYVRQRNLAFQAQAKLDLVEHLLHVHRNDRSILFTQDNETAHVIARRFLIPALTHQTKVTERSAILAALAEGRIQAVVTSKVLNEGVDVPAANVAIVVSGSGSVREHVQRLGRVLRKKEGKRARLYELVTADTSETSVSQRRREHVAYR